MNQAQWYWWCDFYDEPHPSDDADSYDEGPRMRGDDDSHYEEDYPKGAWTFREEAYDGYGGGLWHFTCPGPHHNLWIGAVA